MILGARVLAEFRDDPNRYADPKSRKNHAGTSPVTRASAKPGVLARFARNRRLNDACYLWAFATLTSSTGARTFYGQRRPSATADCRVLRALANRLVGIVHGCLTHRPRGLTLGELAAEETPSSPNRGLGLPGRYPDFPSPAVKRDQCRRPDIDAWASATGRSTEE